MKKRLIILLTAIITVLLLSSCGSNKHATKQIESIDDLNGLNMGCMSGSIFDVLIEEKFPDSNIIYFSSRSELLLGLTSGKIDGFISDEPVAMKMVNENDGVTYLDEAVGEVHYGICFSDNMKNVLSEFNEYLDTISSNGHLKELQDKWIRPTGDKQKKESYTLTNQKGILRCVTTPDAAPFSFLSNGVFEGFEVELLNEFCYEYGYDLQIDTVSFDALLTSVATNKYDIAFNGVFITEERAKSVNFSTSTYEGRDVVMVRSGTSHESKGFIASIIDSFYRNFIEENRYQLLIRGIMVTLIISICSITFGVIGGLLLYMLSTEHPLLKKIIDEIQIILSKLPAVVILMILFYVVFKSSSISGTIVSIIGFSYMFANTYYGLLKTGVSAIDNGQFEAAMALGYDKWTAFFHIILPQALKTIYDAFIREMITLVKNTSIVGYVSVNDITRASDIIRGRTYDALFPLMVVALIYYLLCTILIAILKIPLKYYLFKKVKYYD